MAKLLHIEFGHVPLQEFPSQRGEKEIEPERARAITGEAGTGVCVCVLAVAVARWTK